MKEWFNRNKKNIIPISIVALGLLGVIFIYQPWTKYPQYEVPEFPDHPTGNEKLYISVSNTSIFVNCTGLNPNLTYRLEVTAVYCIESYSVDDTFLRRFATVDAWDTSDSFWFTLREAPWCYITVELSYEYHYQGQIIQGYTLDFVEVLPD